MRSTLSRIVVLLLALVVSPHVAHAQGTPKAKATLNGEVSTNFPDNTGGAITPAILRTTTNDIIASMQQYAGVNAQSGTSYTIQASDYGQLVTFNNANPIAVTIPNAASAGFNPFNVYVSNLGVGAVTITPSVGTINGTANLALAQNQSTWIVSDSTNYQISPTTPTVITSRELLAIDRTYYIRTDGNDSNTCLANTAGGACLTYQGAYNKALLIDANNHNITFQVGAGTYTAALSMTVPILNPASVTWTGDTVTPSNVVLSVTNVDAIYIANIPYCVSLQGMKTVTTTNGNHIDLNYHSCAFLTGKWEFGAAGGSGNHIQSFQSIFIVFANYTISGGATDHLHCDSSSECGADGQTITITGTPAFSGAFLGTAGSATVTFTSATFVGSATGTKYNIHGNSYVKTAAANPYTFFPGNGAGSSDGGNLDDDTGGGAWIPFSPVPTPAGGAFTATSTGAYKILSGSGSKTIVFRTLIGISAAGTGTGAISLAAPLGLSSGYSSFVAREVSASNATGSGYIVNNTASITGIIRADGATSFIQTGANIVVSGTYERQ